jgi:hypothetical protein
VYSVQQLVNDAMRTTHDVTIFSACYLVNVTVKALKEDREVLGIQNARKL